MDHPHIHVSALLAIIALVVTIFLLQEVQVECYDLYQGSWIHDSSIVPYYNTLNCPLILDCFNCQKNGRPNKDYLRYKWQPTSGNLPRFDGLDFVKRFQGKRIMFVGDSLSLNQYQSLTCMLHAAIPRANYTSQTVNGISYFTLPQYKVSIMYSRNAFFVDIVNVNSKRVLKINSMESYHLWEGNDVLIFDTWHWWLHSGRKQAWDYIEDGNRKVADMDRYVLYEKALRTWARWVETRINPTKTKIIFQGVSPDHDDVRDWGGRPTQETRCIGQHQPVFGSKYPRGPHPAESILEKVLGQMRKPVHLLKITTLSQLRKDGHPSFYGSKGHHNFADCTHWCLPGVPDVWNELLYAALKN